MGNDQVEIILVEDNEDDAELVIRGLRKNKLANNIMHFKDGEEVLEFIFGTGSFEGRSYTSSPKVIFLDLKMPKVGGMQVLEQLKSNPVTKSIPVVVLTSSAEDPDIKKCYELGANSYIVKPVDFSNFSKTVTALGLYWMLTNEVR